MNKAKKQEGVTYRQIYRDSRRKMDSRLTAYQRHGINKALRIAFGDRRRSRIKAERMMILADCPACFEKFSREWDCRPHPVRANERIQDDFCCRCRFIKRGGQH